MPDPNFSEMQTGDPVEAKEYKHEPKGVVVDLDTFREQTVAAQKRVGREVDGSAAARADREKTQQDIERMKIQQAEQRKAEPVDSLRHRKQWEEDFPNNIENPAGNMLSRRQLEKGDGIITRIQNYFYKRGGKK